MNMKCFECPEFETRCYVSGSVVSICNKRNEVVSPEDSCKSRDRIRKAWEKKVGWNRRLKTR
jgi:hypothetical protein